MTAIGKTMHERTRQFLAGLGGLRSRPRGPRILLYHRVGAENHRYSVPREQFVCHLDYLEEAGYRVLSVSDLLAADAGGGKAVAVGFVDGYFEMLDVVAPLLAARDMGATFFIQPWLQRPPVHGEDEALMTASSPFQSVSLVAGLSRSGFEIAARLCDELLLTDLDDAIARDAIVGARRELAALLGFNINGFAYPQGVHNVQHRNMVSRAGFRWALTLRPGVVRAGDDFLSLPATELVGDVSVDDLARILDGECDDGPAWRWPYRRPSSWGEATA